MPRIRTRSLIAIGLTVGAGLVWTSTASAATITVTTAGDEFNTAPAAGCSLREAVEAANTNAAFGGCPAGGMVADTVELPQGVQLTRTGADNTNVNGDIDVTSSDLTITGTGVGEREIRNDGGGDRVLHVGSGLTGVALSNVAIKDGNTSGDGGGILNEGTLGLARVSISTSFAGGNGGGISYTSTGTGTITNSTISGNVTNGSGGGIANSQPAAFQPVFNNITVTNNTADQDESGDGSGGYAGFAGGADIANSILAGNIDGSPSSANPNCGGAPLISSGYNLAGADCELVATGDTSTLSGLAALAFNGGNSLTHALLAGSPAINTGNPGPGGALCIATDQRGVAREGVCDRGAYEFVTPPPAPTVTDSDPNSPADDNSPEIKGTAQAGSTVQLYTDSTCTTPVGPATPAANFASPGITVSVADNTTTTFYATTATPGATSVCSSAGLTYQEVTPPTGGGGTTTPTTPITPVTPGTPAPKKCKKGQKLKKGKCVKKKKRKKK